MIDLLVNQIIKIISDLFLIIIIDLVVIKIIKVITSKKVITGYPIIIKKANLKVIIFIKTLEVPEAPKAPEVPEVPEEILGKLIGLLDYLILIGLYYSSIKTIPPLKA